MKNEKNTNFSIKFEKKDDYLYVFVKGLKDSLTVSKRMWEKIYTKAKELGFEAVLIEEDFPNQLSTLEMLQIGEFIAEKFMGFKIAHVDRHLSDVELNKFGETVAVNRGAFGRVFNNIMDAEKWLKQY
jgi:hypothetical protein